jgi:hypothetical protein
MSQNVVLQVQLSGVWTDVPLFSSTPAAFARGSEPYASSWPSPQQLTCEINNDSLAWDPARPESPIYGIAGRNTPARLRIDGVTAVYGEATAWVPDRTVEHQPGLQRGRAWVSFTAYGQLQRLQDWTDPVRSPMYRTISGRSTSVGHWPLEDPKNTRSLANTAAGGAAGTFKGGPSFAESERPFGAASTVGLSADTQLAGVFKSASSTAGWQISFSFKADSLPGAGTYGRILRWTTSVGYTWLLEFSDTVWRWTATDSSGTSLWTSVVVYDVAPPSSWVTMRIKVSQSGGNVVVEPGWYQQGAGVLVGITDSFAGNVGALRSWWHDGNATADGCWLSHVFAVTGVADDLQSGTALAVFNGYAGERVLSRYVRILTEIGMGALAFYSGGPASNSLPMGPQPIDSVINILKEVRDTDGGMLTDEQGGAGLNFRMRRGLYTKAVAYTFDYAAGHIAPPFRRLTGADNISNVVTVKNTDQGEYTATLTTGANSTAPPPAGISEKRTSVDVNLSNDQDVTDRATWELARLSIEGPRYGEFTVDLLKNPGLAAGLAALREGDHVVITGYPPDDVHLLITGIKGTTGAIARTMTFQVEPYDVYRVGIWDATDWRYDARTSTLAAAATSTATSLSLSCTDPNDVWSTTTPYALLIGGERVTATVMTAPAGTGPYTQTATVTRSVNGVVKAQTAGTEVHVSDYQRWGL